MLLGEPSVAITWSVVSPRVNVEVFPESSRWLAPKRSRCSWEPVGRWRSPKHSPEPERRGGTGCRGRSFRPRSRRTPGRYRPRLRNRLDQTEGDAAPAKARGVMAKPEFMVTAEVRTEAGVGDAPADVAALRFPTAALPVATAELVDRDVLVDVGIGVGIRIDVAVGCRGRGRGLRRGRRTAATGFLARLRAGTREAVRAAVATLRTRPAAERVGVGIRIPIRIGMFGVDVLAANRGLRSHGRLRSRRFRGLGCGRVCLHVARRLRAMGRSSRVTGSARVALLNAPRHGSRSGQGQDQSGPQEVLGFRLRRSGRGESRGDKRSRFHWDSPFFRAASLLFTVLMAGAKKYFKTSYGKIGVKAARTPRDV